MADPFDRAWDFMKNEDEDHKQYNTTGNIDPNRSSRIVDMFSGLGGSPSHPQPKEFRHNIQIPRKFSDLTPSHEQPPMEEVMDILEQIRQGGKPSDIHGSPPFNPMRDQQRGEGGQHPDMGRGQEEDKPNPYGSRRREQPQREPQREPQGDHPMRQDPSHATKKPKLGEGLIGRSKKALDEEKALRAKEKKSQEGNKGGNEPKESDGDKDE